MKAPITGIISGRSIIKTYFLYPSRLRFYRASRKAVAHPVRRAAHPLPGCATAFWVCYGTIVLPSPPLIANNTIGLALSLFYVLCFVVARPTLGAKATVAAQ